MNPFTPGTRVKLIKGSFFYTQAPDQLGTVVENEVVNPKYWVTVRFDNGYRNAYRINGGPPENPGVDLELAGPKVQVHMTRKETKHEGR